MKHAFYQQWRVFGRRAIERVSCILFCWMVSGAHAAAQATGIPGDIAELFYIQYPYATDLKCLVKEGRTTIDFLMKNEKYEAVYKKSEWKYTIMDFSFDRLPEKIKAGFRRSRLGTAVVADVDVVYVPSGYETYRFQLQDTLSAKKYHYFSESGKLLHTPASQN
ncbi:hypothetical protein [Niabella drilacis]|uniref:Beta-lactamase-inhibitor-like, PepSY-like n=1 Tax=Niabella drilacis (strain DSM 25811 / CCM 8410 / CCUG 62505 / LMG 26954 / E90) TaxID=1285928 RepID=A0A1G6INU4_NIADE|nr:hypothetical protein [Niabella drilacis]SDC08144.1 hypothetical protein SAMN04487894_101285 [Niabella drilacis]